MTDEQRITRLETQLRAAMTRIGQLEVQVQAAPAIALQGYYLPASADFAIDPLLIGRYIVVDLTGNHTGTLPYMEPGNVVAVMNVGTGTLTLKNSAGTTIASLDQGQETLAVAGTADAIGTPVAVAGGMTT